LFELFDHTADLGLRVRASTLEALLVDAARGLLAMQIANPEAVQPTTRKDVSLSAEQPSFLLFDWLSELLFAFESEKLLLCEWDVHIDRGGEGFRLAATCRGESMDRTRHEMEHEVKAITYHGLSVAQADDGTWLAEAIVDI
jgi:SHS2 domain-containing protein